jgi:phosphoglycerate dehydrogenase-like enzyme
MHVVIADQLSSSAIEILRTVPGFTVDARPGRPAAELAKDLADADALVVRSATQVDAKLLAAGRPGRASTVKPGTVRRISIAEDESWSAMTTCILKV